MTAYRVFVSHGWHDRWVAKQMARLISEAGADAFVDIFDIAKGDRIEDRIREELPRCQELVALITPWSVERNWVWTEIASAWILMRRFVAVLYGVSLQEIAERHGGTACLSTTNIAMLDEFDDYVRELSARVTVAAS